MPRMIKSKNELFLGQLVEKPKRAIIVSEDAEGTMTLACPNCSVHIVGDDYDVIGAEPGCGFCNHCNREFELP